MLSDARSKSPSPHLICAELFNLSPLIRIVSFAILTIPAGTTRDDRLTDRSVTADAAVHVLAACFFAALGRQGPSQSFSRRASVGVTGGGGLVTWLRATSSLAQVISGATLPRHHVVIASLAFSVFAFSTYMAAVCFCHCTKYAIDRTVPPNAPAFWFSAQLSASS